MKYSLIRIDKARNDASTVAINDDIVVLKQRVENFSPDPSVFYAIIDHHWAGCCVSSVGSPIPPAAPQPKFRWVGL